MRLIAHQYDIVIMGAYSTNQQLLFYAKHMLLLYMCILLSSTVFSLSVDVIKSLINNSYAKILLASFILVHVD